MLINNQPKVPLRNSQNNNNSSNNNNNNNNNNNKLIKWTSKKY